ncbi:MAG: hypothetical protein J1F66_05600 [Clostridiales bacterium]|nr:hypothetical protein [Clostridiales bacterium]
MTRTVKILAWGGDGVETKYPIVLAHGIAVREWRFFKAFGRVEKTLREAGYVVYTANTDAFGSIENNAAQLKTQIEEILRKEGVDKVNIIAHSKGGLDAKYMINELGEANSVASLTTLCTPHKGSRMATRIYNLPRWIPRFLAFWINLWSRILGDKHPDALTVCQQLQLSESDEIETLDASNEVYCQSYSSTMKRGRDDFLMSVPHYFARRWGEVETDGLVTVDSAKYAEYRGDCIEESLSHTELIGLSLKKKKRRKVYAFYLSLCRELSERGF